LKIFVIHNHYRQPGGEDQVFEAETKLLESNGHEVFRYEMSNEHIAEMNATKLAKSTVWNSLVMKDLRNLIRKEKPQIAHFHNTLPLLSPGAYYAAKTEGIPVVKTLHNYRMFCLNGLLFRDNKVCELCMNRWVPMPGLIHACYRSSYKASLAVTAMLSAHKLLRTWDRSIDLYIAPSEFAKQKYIQSGLAEHRIFVKPNFMFTDPLKGKGDGQFALFVGRLSPEKGVQVVISAWEKCGHRIPLKIAGDGPEMKKIVKQDNRHIEILGWQSHSQILQLMESASFLIFPSVWYENLPMTIIEAYASGLPVIASNMGSMPSLIDPGRTGLLFKPNDPDDLADKVSWVLDNPENLDRMRVYARSEFEEQYTSEKNYHLLMEAYKKGIAIAAARGTI